jgi:3-oxoacyl-[acyl-carrier-protein] synthase II
MSDTGRRVAITGVGLLTGLGVGTDETWRQLLDGSSAVGQLDRYDPSSLRTQLGAEIRDLRPRDFVANRRSLRTMTDHDLFATVAAVLAVRDAGLELGDDPEGRVALFVGGNKETNDPDKWEEIALAVRRDDGTVDMKRFGEQASSSVAPLFYLEGLQAASLFYISEAFGARGPNTYFAGTAEAGLLAIGRGFRAIKRGEADVAIAGGADAPLGWWNMAKLDALGAFTHHNELGRGACRPYDRDRDGTVPGEGAAYVVLEDLERAAARGAVIYAEVTGFGTATDTRRVITPDPSGAALAQAVEGALAEARVPVEQVGYVAAEGSGTRRGDASEARALCSTARAGSSSPASSLPSGT